MSTKIEVTFNATNAIIKTLETMQNYGVPIGMRLNKKKGEVTLFVLSENEFFPFYSDDDIIGG